MKKIRILLVFLLTVVAAGPGFRAQEETDLGEVARQSARALADAKEAYANADFSRAISVLNQMLGDMGPAQPGTLPVEDENLRIEAFRIRGISYYNLGQPAEANRDFESAIALDPNIQLDRSLLSPKIVDAFEAVREQKTGLLNVLSDPPGADVRLGRRPMGATPVEGVRVLAGRYPIGVSKRGHEAVQGAIDVVPGKTTTHEVALARNARNVNLITIPAGVRVLVDGTEIGVTSGTLPPAMEAKLMDRGIDSSRASAPLTIPYLPAGEHLLRVEKDCHAPFEAVFNVVIEETDLPLDLEPVLLTESLSDATFESTPPGAKVIIDGRQRGVTPVVIKGLCAGETAVVMERSGVGRWSETVTLQEGPSNEFRARLQAGLASFGTVRSPGAASDPSWDRFLAKVIEQQTAYNGSTSHDGETGRLRAEIYERILADETGAPVLEERTRRDLMSDARSDLLVVGVPGDGRGGHLLLYGAELDRPDRIEVPALDDATAGAIARKLSRPLVLEVPWSGLITVETARTDFPLVLGIPDDKSGTTVKPGDRIESVNGQPVPGRAELEAAFEGAAEGESVQVLVDRGGQKVKAVVVTALTPVLPRPGEPGVLVNKHLLDARIQKEIAQDETRRSLAALNVGLAFLMADEPDLALREGFRQAKLPEREGVGRGTVDYLVGLALEARGASGESARAFESAAGSQSTLWRDDGPLAAPLAEARLGRPS